MNIRNQGDREWQSALAPNPTDPLSKDAQSVGMEPLPSPDLGPKRYRRAAGNALANMAARSAGILLMILTVHWATPYLGPERFGVLATFT
ncbi:MAG: hypothetical protein ACREUE_09600, partial [Panacagrimonas sp.]